MTGLLLSGRALENQSIIGMEPQGDVLPPWEKVGRVELAAQAKGNVAMFSWVYDLHLKAIVRHEGTHWQL